MEFEGLLDYLSCLNKLEVDLSCKYMYASSAQSGMSIYFAFEDTDKKYRIEMSEK